MSARRVSTAAQQATRIQNRRLAGRVAWAAVLVTVVFGASRVLRAGDTTVAARLYVSVLGLVVVAAVVVLMWRRFSRPPHRQPGRLLDRLARSTDEPVSPRRTHGFERAHDSVTAALGSAEGRDRWLRADVREIVDARIDDAVTVAHPARPPVESSRAARSLRPATWELIRPDRPPVRADGAGLTAAELAVILDDLERL